MNEYLDKARTIFAGCGLTITAEDRKMLGAAFGKKKGVNVFIDQKVLSFVKEIERLAKFTTTQPQAVPSAFPHGLVNKWVFFYRTSEGLTLSVSSHWRMQ